MQSLLVVIREVDWDPSLSLPDQECCSYFLTGLGTHGVLLTLEEEVLELQESPLVEGVLRQDGLGQVALSLLREVDPLVEASSEITLQLLGDEPQPSLEDAPHRLVHLVLHSNQVAIEHLPLPYSEVSDHPYVDARALLPYLLQLDQLLALLEERLLKGLLRYDALDLNPRQLVDRLLEVDFQRLHVLVNLNGAVVGLKLHLLALLRCLVSLGQQSVHLVRLDLGLCEAGVDSFEVESVLEIFKKVLPKAIADQINPYFQKLDSKLGLQFDLIRLLH